MTLRSPRVFISYRHDDDPAATDLLKTALKDHFGEENVFADVDSVEIGADFADVIADYVGRCDVLIAVIGRRWVDAVGDDGKRRLDDPDDWVRAEIRTGLQRRDVRVVPALVYGARMPKKEALPEDLRDLLRRNAIELPRLYFEPAIASLIKRIEQVTASTENEVRPTDAVSTTKPRVGEDAERGIDKSGISSDVYTEQEEPGARGTPHAMVYGDSDSDSDSGRGRLPRRVLLVGLGMGLLIIAAIVIVATQLGGPGSSNPGVTTTGNNAQASNAVASTLKTYFTALVDGNGAVACAQLTSSGVRNLIQSPSAGGARTCADAVQTASQALNNCPPGKQALLDATVTSVDVNGGDATAGVVGATGTAAFTNADGRWLLDGAGTIHFPGSC